MTAPYTAHTVKLAEEFALFSTLTHYPREKSFDEVIAELQAHAEAANPLDETLAAFGQYESYTRAELAEVIERLQNTRTMALQQFGNCVDIAVELAGREEENPHPDDVEAVENFVSDFHTMIHAARIATGIESSLDDEDAPDADALRG